jgi:hypothetical protein
MVVLTEEYANQEIEKLFAKNNPADAAIKSYDKLGKIFIDHNIQGRDHKSMEMLYAINTNISKTQWLVAIASAAQMRPEVGPGNLITVMVLPKHIETLSFIYHTSAEIADFLVENYEMVSFAAEKPEALQRFEEDEILFQQKFEETKIMELGDKPEVLFNQQSILYLRSFNFTAFLALTDNDVLAEYVEWQNMIGDLINKHREAFEKKHGIKRIYIS